MTTSLVEQIASLGIELNANQYKVVRLATQYDATLDWFREGFKSSAVAIAHRLDIHDSTAREWIRVGHALDELGLVNDAFASNDLSYAKAHILTRWADRENEAELLEIAHDRTANRLTTAIAKHLAGTETDEDRDQRQHDSRSVTVYTDADGMVVVRATLPPNVGKHVVAAIDTIVQQVAATPMVEPIEEEDADVDASADASTPLPVEPPTALRQQNVSADAATTQSPTPGQETLGEQIRQLKQSWQPEGADDCFAPTLTQQRCDAFVLLFLGKNIDLTTEVVIHVRGEGTTFDDGTPLTNNAVCQRLERSFIRLLLHSVDGSPIDATNSTCPRLVQNRHHSHSCSEAPAGGRR